MTFRCEAWRYSFLDQVAAEAREASRRYWANADRQHPVAKDIDRIWPLGGRSEIATKSKKAWLTRAGRGNERA